MRLSIKIISESYLPTYQFDSENSTHPLIERTMRIASSTSTTKKSTHTQKHKENLMKFLYSKNPTQKYQNPEKKTEKNTPTKREKLPSVTEFPEKKSHT